ncbi:MAG: collagen binding domain-containing protein [Oscillospiraceae bacterium]
MVIRDIYLLQRSEQFNLGPRQEVTVDLSLKKVPKPPRTVLVGTVTGKCGQIEGATVKVFDRSNKPIAHTVTDNKGKFVFENILPPGEYKVIATAEGYQVSRVYRLMLESRKPVSRFIWLEVSNYVNLATIYGVVYNEVNLGLANAKIMITDYDKPEICKVYTQTNEDGEYLVYGLKPGKYRITALIEGYMPPDKISFELLPNEISCVNLFLYPDVSLQDGTISGKINFYGKGEPNAVVALYKVEGSGHILLATKETNKSGFYLFPNVKPGEYLVKSKMETDRITDFTG